jgi:hypothetical protein
VVHLTTSKSLKKLHMPFCRTLTDDGIRELEKIPTLEELDLSSTKVTGLSHLAASRSLRKILLHTCGGITDASILGLERIPTLEELALTETKVTRVTRLSSCPRPGIDSVARVARPIPHASHQPSSLIRLQTTSKLEVGRLLKIDERGHRRTGTHPDPNRARSQRLWSDECILCP